MTRKEAIEKLVEAWLSRDAEECFSYEKAESQAELIDSLITLGVSTDDISHIAELSSSLANLS